MPGMMKHVVQVKATLPQPTDQSFEAGDSIFHFFSSSAEHFVLCSFSFFFSICPYFSSKIHCDLRYSSTDSSYSSCSSFSCNSLALLLDDSFCHFPDFMCKLLGQIIIIRSAHIHIQATRQDVHRWTCLQRMNATTNYYRLLCFSK